MPDWLNITLTTLPSILWIIIGLGLPWALVVLPRRDWSDRPMIACLSLAFGPALLTAWMFILGTIGQDTNPDAGATLNPMQTTIIRHVGGEALMRPDLILLGTVVLSILGYGLVIWKLTQTPKPDGAIRKPFTFDERFLIAMIVFATLARWWIAAWLPFGSWDPLWVYGYQGRIYTLTGYIPADIGYYPQFMPLLYAYGQIVSAGEISDHAARAIMPFIQIGSILAAYILGSRLYNRRTGIVLAAIWALYPHFGYWTRVGDLEIPVTFGFTGAAAFFLMAWTKPAERVSRRYALIAGLFFGIAMWTKPTAGAFIWGVLLVLIVALLDWKLWRLRFRLAFLTGLACIPLGAVWYLRNVLIGHDAIVFPPAFWLTQARRSGGEFGWPLLALIVLLAYLHFGPVKRRPGKLGTILGLILLAIGVVPTILEPARMGLPDWLFFGTGLLILTLTLLDYYLSGDVALPTLKPIGWASLLALPYFVTWFYSYSYHYRLSFTIVPLMILPTAVVLAHWLTSERIQSWQHPMRLAYTGLLSLACILGVLIAVFDEGLGWDWLWTIPEQGDYSEAALLGVEDTLREYLATHDESPVVLAPGLQTLPFFFPGVEIRTVPTPRQIDELGGIDLFIHSKENLLAYANSSEQVPYQNQWLNSMNRQNVATRLAAFADPSFFYDVFELHPDQRFDPIEPVAFEPQEVVFGEFARYYGYRVFQSSLTHGGILVEIYWQALQPAPIDYTVFVHFIKDDDAEQTVWAQTDGPPVPWELGAYSTLFWEPGEYIIDRRQFFVQDEATPPGTDYYIHFGFYDPSTGKRVPVFVNGVEVGDSYRLGTPLSREIPPG